MSSFLPANFSATILARKFFLTQQEHQLTLTHINHPSTDLAFSAGIVYCCSETRRKLLLIAECEVSLQTRPCSIFKFPGVQTVCRGRTGNIENWTRPAHYTTGIVWSFASLRDRLQKKKDEKHKGIVFLLWKKGGNIFETAFQYKSQF